MKSATVAKLQGQAVAVDTNGNQRPLSVGDSLALGEVVRTLDGSSLSIQLDDGQSIDMSASDSIALDESVLSSESFGADAQIDDRIAALLDAVVAGDDIELDATAAGDAGVASDGASLHNTSFVSSGSESVVSASDAAPSGVAMTDDGYDPINTQVDATAPASDIAASDTSASDSPSKEPAKPEAPNTPEPTEPAPKPDPDPTEPETKPEEKPVEPTPEPDPAPKPDPDPTEPEVPNTPEPEAPKFPSDTTLNGEIKLIDVSDDGKVLTPTAVHDDHITTSKQIVIGIQVKELNPDSDSYDSSLQPQSVFIDLYPISATKDDTQVLQYEVINNNGEFMIHPKAQDLVFTDYLVVVSARNLGEFTRGTILAKQKITIAQQKDADSTDSDTAPQVPLYDGSWESKDLSDASYDNKIHETLSDLIEDGDIDADYCKVTIYESDGDTITSEVQDGKTTDSTPTLVIEFEDVSTSSIQPVTIIQGDYIVSSLHGLVNNGKMLITLDELPEGSYKVQLPGSIIVAEFEIASKQDTQESAQESILDISDSVPTLTDEHKDSTTKSDKPSDLNPKDMLSSDDSIKGLDDDKSALSDISASDKAQDTQIIAPQESQASLSVPAIDDQIQHS